MNSSAARSSQALSLIGLLLLVIMNFIQVNGFTPSPAPAEGPTSDGTALDQGIACFLMLAALAITYLMH
ncbi:hypothetical protein MKW98_015835 [Papaver atlanticum]|uniref:Uncharacterized protein n=1 Tax=Papaver atlanticum TaxID=357466 RepID=A0AAD4S7T0_9MAGN|nr:hypothetical protein MKW98_015835 [Papaver atlanticum]